MSRRAAIGHAAASFLMIAVIVIGGLAFVSSMDRPSGRSTAGGVSETTFYSGVTSGLQLQIKLNTTAMLQGGALGARVLLVNTLSENLSPRPDFTANPNIVSWDRYDSICGLSPVDHIFGFALLQGRYTAANLSTAGEPMLLTPPVGVSCPNPFYDQSYVQHVEFAPKSDVATLSANSSYSDVFKPKTIKMETTASTGGCSVTSYTVISGTEIYDSTTTTYGQSGHLTHGCGGGSVLNGYWTRPANESYFPISRTPTTRR